MDAEIFRFDWTNPHSWIHYDAVNETGETERWVIELGDPRGLASNGWLPDTIKRGDKVTMWINPLRNGQPGGAFLGMQLENGDVYGDLYVDGVAVPAAE